MKLLFKLLAVAVWLVILVQSYALVAMLMNAPSTIAVVGGVLVGVFLGWALYESAKIMWRMK